MEVVVICASCGTLCPHTWDDAGHVLWLWEGRKCEKCGEENWAAHDPARDWQTGHKTE